ncbi:MAG: TonB-dependent receptor plug domain-containing protein, partial [Pseudomonadota bacterium]|nr:TonB-dependent receptor plug domain-containing protein [Pseudomonadota bacterium]
MAYFQREIWGLPALAGLFLALPLPVGAQDTAPIDLNPIVVTGTWLPTDQTGASTGATRAGTTVITREMIDARRPSSVVELLRDTPGLHIDQPGGRGGVSSVYLRGADPNFTVVLIDGVRVKDPTNSRGGSYNFKQLDPGSNERIEIVRGTLSA